MLIFEDVPGSNLGPEAVYANKVRGFPESLQIKKVGIVPEISHGHFFQNHFQFIIRRRRNLTSKICHTF